MKNPDKNNKPFVNVSLEPNGTKELSFPFLYYSTGGALIKLQIIS